MSEHFVVSCPHCQELILIYYKDVNCKIFRHGAFRDTLLPIDPHTPKELCDVYVKENKIYGCGKPFQLLPSAVVNMNSGDSPTFTTEICGYV